MFITEQCLEDVEHSNSSEKVSDSCAEITNAENKYLPLISKYFTD